uniref:Ribonuclease n=1 Tax=Rhodnius prolixus TaxID=13249 RepID=T1I159_RHOPR
MASKVHISSTEDLQSVADTQDKKRNFYISSSVPEICKNEPCVAGIDEAGRGPVLGPMVYGICYCPKLKEDQLKETGCADSKTLTEEKREKILNLVCSEGYIGWEVDVISPNFISNCMLRRQKYSLNEISHNSAITLIKRAIEAGVKVTDVFVDTVGPAEKYEEKLKSFFPELNITVAKKADSKFPVVGAASICAKVTRDICLKTWTFPELSESTAAELSWGSGYPNDPETKKFLMNNIDQIFGFSQLVRFSWSTAEKVLEENAITVEWDEEDLPKQTRSMKSFFGKSNGHPKHRYFKDRNLTSVVKF